MVTPTPGDKEENAIRLRPLSSKEQQKQAEFRLVEELAIQRRCTPIRVPEEQQWPDARLREPDGTELPVEVVAAYWRKPGEDPRKGSPWKRAHVKATKEAHERTEATGMSHHFGAHYDEPFVVPADSKSLIPLSGTQPVRPDRWILVALEQKVGKRYSEMSILLVDLHHFESPRFEDWDLGERIATLAAGRFREVWITDQYSHIPKRLYLRSSW